MATPLIQKMIDLENRNKRDLLLRKQLADQYNQATRDAQKVVITPVKQKEITESEKRENSVMQRQLAFTNLSTLMSETEANVYLSNYSNDNNNYFINSNFKDISTELKGKTNNTARFFNDFMQQYIQKWRDTNETGISRPLTETQLTGALDTRLNILDNALKFYIGKKLNQNFQKVLNKFNQLRAFITTLPNDISKPIIDQLTDAIQTDNDKYATQIMELITDIELKGLNEVSNTELLDALQELQEAASKLVPQPKVKQKTKTQLLNEILAETGKKQGDEIELNDGSKVKLNLRLTKDEIIKILSDIVGKDPDDVASVTSVMTGTTTSTGSMLLPTLEMAVPKNLVGYFNSEPNEMNIYGLISLVRKEELIDFIESSVDLKNEAKFYDTPLKRLNREDLNMFIYDLIKEKKIKLDDITGLPTLAKRPITDYNLIPKGTNKDVNTSRKDAIYEQQNKRATKIAAMFRGKKQMKKYEEEREKQYQEQLKKNQQILDDHNDQIRLIEADILKFPDIPLPPDGISKGDLLAMLNDYDKAFRAFPKPTIRSSKKQIEDYDAAQTQAKAIKIELDERIVEISTALKGAVNKAEIDRLKAEGIDIRNRRNNVNKEIQRLDKEHGSGKLKKKRYNQLKTPLTLEYKNLNKQIDEINKKLAAIGATRIEGTAIIKKRIGKGLLPTQRDRYMKFGKYTIHTPSLDKGMINLKYNSLTSLDKIQPKYVSNKFIDIINAILEDENNFNKQDYNELEEEERKYFDKIITTCHLNKTIGHKTEINRTDIEELRRFEILKGELISGNNAPQLLKELKKYILKFINDGRLSKMNGQSLLYEISLLEK